MTAHQDLKSKKIRANSYQTISYGVIEATSIKTIIIIRYNLSCYAVCLSGTTRLRLSLNLDVNKPVTWMQQIPTLHALCWYNPLGMHVTTHAFVLLHVSYPPHGNSIITNCSQQTSCCVHHRPAQPCTVVLTCQANLRGISTPKTFCKCCF